MGAFLAVLASVFIVVGNVYAKEWVIKPSMAVFVFAEIAFMLAALSFPLALRYGSLTLVTAAVAATTTFITSLIGIYLYHEHMGLVQMIGMGLMLVSAGLFSFLMKG